MAATGVLTTIAWQPIHRDVWPPHESRDPSHKHKSMRDPTGRDRSDGGVVPPRARRRDGDATAPRASEEGLESATGRSSEVSRTRARVVAGHGGRNTRRA